MKGSTSLLATYRDLIAEVRRLCKGKRTGTIFITSEDGHIVRFVLSHGEVIHLVFDTKHSCYDAIPLIHQIRSGRLQFAEGIVETVPGVQLPNTEELLHTLELFYELDQEETTSKKATPQALQPTFNVSAAILRIRKSLATYLGPFAAIICDDYLKKVGAPKAPEEVLTMIDTLALEISEPKAAKEFKVHTKEDLFQAGIL
jgi:hypothetical protein